MASTGFLIIPGAIIADMSIFCDTGFIILSGLAKAFSARTKAAMPLIAGALGCSLSAVHCLIPAHPGALAAAGILDDNIGNLVILGIVFAVPGFFVSYFWVKRMTKGKNYPPSPESEIPPKEPEHVHSSVLLSFLSIVIPLILIATGSLLNILPTGPDNILIKVLAYTGKPVIALLIGVVFALMLLANRKINTLNAFFETAIEKAGPILIIIAACGMFGMIIKETCIGAIAGVAISKTGLGLIIPFLIALIMKTAQGSSTVAIITAMSIIAPMMPILRLDSQTGKLFAMLAMGAGSMMITHAYDFYFWVITMFSNIHADITMRVYSTATVVMGITVFTCVWVTSLFFVR